MNKFDLAKEYLSMLRYQILEEDAEEGYLSFRYQMNTIYFFGNPNDDEHFFFMTLPDFTEVTAENMAQVKENCHRINKDAKLVKLYVMGDVILATAEIYYLAEDDFRFQMKTALQHLVAAKVMYKKLDE